MINTKLVWNVIVIILLFTAGDYFGHKYLEKNNNLDVVPLQYYTNKIIYGSIILFITLMFIGRFELKGYSKVFVITSIVVLALQFRYYNLYSQKFNYYVMALHYLVLAPIIYYFQNTNRI